jgi:hypothetical protein
MAFIGLPCPINKTGMRGVFSPENLILLISSYFMAFNILGDERTEPIKDHRFIV